MRTIKCSVILSVYSNKGINKHSNVAEKTESHKAVGTNKRKIEVLIQSKKIISPFRWNATRKKQVSIHQTF